MRILFALPHCPIPVDSGSKQLTMQAIETLAGRHEVGFVVLRGPDRTERIDDLAQFGTLSVVDAPHRRSLVHRAGYRAAYVLSSLVTGRPLHSFYGCPANFWRTVQNVTGRWEPDLIHYDFWYSAVRDGGGLQCRRLLLEQDVEFVRLFREAELQSSFRRWRLERAAGIVRKAEGSVLRRMDCVLTVTPADARAAKEAGARRVAVFPVGVDTESRTPPASEPGGQGILFVGGFVHRPNVDGILWFARSVFPRILRVHPGATLTIVGGGPPESVRELGRSNGQIRVTGWVDDVTPFYHSARVVVAPLRFGSGIKTKVLEAMAFGRPVVTTTIGVEGIEISPGENILVQDSPDGFAEAVSLLLGHPEQARALGLAGRAVVERFYSKKAARQRILEIYEKDCWAPGSVSEGQSS